ncbi:MAG: carboxypeptidase regulatory-like domain-containing protein [Bacteroidota bacterium]
MKKLLSFLLVLILAACSKKDNSAISLTTGTLSGVITPAGAAAEVYIVANVSGQSRSFHSQPDGNGHFAFKDLPPGEYTINFDVTPGYYLPNVVETSVSVGKEQSLGNVDFLDLRKTGNITGNINPLNAATYVIATRENSGANIPEVYATVNASTGIFELTRVLPGKYTLRFGNTLGFAAEPLKSVSVTVDQSTPVGTINFRNAATGSISGTVSPATEVLQIWANYIGAFSKLYTVKPESDGKFRIENVSPGNYFVAATVNAGSGFFAPYSRYYTVTESNDTKVDAITLTSTPPPLPVSCSIDGVLNQATYASALLSPRTLTISTSLKGLAFAITLRDFTELADRTFTSMNGSVIFLGEHKKPGPIGGLGTIGYEKLWYANSTGTVHITAIDPEAKTISGTFSGTLNESKDPSNIKIITNGVFTNLQYR